MNESNSIEAIGRGNLIYQTKFRLNEISKIENYFKQEIKERKLMSKNLSKYVATFDYIDFNCSFCNKWLSICYLFYNCYWSSYRNRKHKFYFTFFSNYRDN